MNTESHQKFWTRPSNHQRSKLFHSPCQAPVSVSKTSQNYWGDPTWRENGPLMSGLTKLSTLLEWSLQLEPSSQYLVFWIARLGGNATTHLSLANSRLLWTSVCWLFTIQNHIICPWGSCLLFCWLCKVWHWFHSCNYWESFRQIYMIHWTSLNYVYWRDMEVPLNAIVFQSTSYTYPVLKRGWFVAGKPHRTQCGIFRQAMFDDTRGYTHCIECWFTVGNPIEYIITYKCWKTIEYMNW